MNDEIKVLLDYLNDEKWEYYPSDMIPYKVLLMEERDLLLDYITNLQQENEYLKLNNPEMNIEHFRIINENKRKIDNLRKQNKDLQRENETLHENNQSMQEEMARTWQKCDDLQQENEEWGMIFDTFSSRPYAHRYLEEKRKELGNKKIIGLDSEMIYKDYYDYKLRCEKALSIIDKQKKKMYKSRNKIALFILMKLENILQNGSEEK